MSYMYTSPIIVISAIVSLFRTDKTEVFTSKSRLHIINLIELPKQLQKELADLDVGVVDNGTSIVCNFKNIRLYNN